MKLPEKICQIFIVFFGSWTLLTNITVFSGLSFNNLTYLSFLAPFTAIVLWYLAKMLDKGKTSYKDIGKKEYINHEWIWLISGALTVFLFVYTKKYWLFLVPTIFLLATALYTYQKSTCQSAAVSCEPVSRSLTFSMLIFLSVFVLFYSLFCSRYNIDDCLYLNMGLSALDNPDAPLIETESLHDFGSLPLFSGYRGQSFELLYTLISRLLHLNVITSAHIIMPAVFGILSIMAASVFFRKFMPGNWLLPLLLYVLILIFDSSPHRSFGNFSLIRLFQGKSVFLTIVIPLIFIYTIEFCQKPGYKKWLFLAMGHIAASGLTVTSVYIAPVITILAAIPACVFSSNEKKLRIFSGAVSTFFYTVIITVLIRIKTPYELIMFLRDSANVNRNYPGSVKGSFKVCFWQRNMDLVICRYHRMDICSQ